jgi:FkbM family methyltransferase
MRIRAEDLTNQMSVARTLPRDYDDVYEEVTSLKPGMAFIDIGANQGLFTLVAGKRVGPNGVVLAFEPDPANFALLVGNAAENNLTNVFPFNAAVGQKNGVESFRPGPATHSGVGHLALDGPVRVKVMNFKDNMSLFGKLLGGRRMTIKIDVEGYEAHVVNAMSELLEWPSVEKVIVEVDEENLAEHGSTATEVYGILTSVGFQARRGQGAAAHYNEVFLRSGVR